AQHEKRIQDINKVLIGMDDNNLQLVYQSIVQPTNDKKMNQKTLRQRLIDRVKQLSDDQLKSAALNFVNSSLYKAGQDSDSLIQKNKALQKQVTQLEHSNAKKSHKVRQLIGTVSQYELKQRYHISKVRAAARKPIPADFRSLKAGIQAIIMKNKRQYAT
ncbi:6572_t:CDS:2, partial [Racocetra persica]